VTERRIKDRIECHGDYIVYGNSFENRISCELKNISVTGACVEMQHVLKRDDKIVLHLCKGDDISLSAKVVWRDDKKYGLVFLLDTAEEFEHISYIMNNIGVS